MKNKTNLKLINDLIKNILSQKPEKYKLTENSNHIKKYRVSLKISSKEAAKRMQMSLRNWRRMENESDLDKIPDYVYLLLKLGALNQSNNVKEYKEWLKNNYE